MQWIASASVSPRTGKTAKSPLFLIGVVVIRGAAGEHQGCYAEGLSQVQEGDLTALCIASYTIPRSLAPVEESSRRTECHLMM